MIAMALSGAVMAEDTSSTIRGQITGPEGNAAANTKIIIVHVSCFGRSLLGNREQGGCVAPKLKKRF